MYRLLDYDVSSPRSSVSQLEGQNEDVTRRQICKFAPSAPILYPKSTISTLNPEADSFIFEKSETLPGGTPLSPLELPNPGFEVQNEEDPTSILRLLKSKNADRPVIAQLNINFIAPKFEPLTSIIKDNVDLLMISETKVDDTFPTEQFRIEGYSNPIRLDRNRHGGGIMIFSRDDLPCHELSSHVLPPDVECTQTRKIFHTS